VARTGAEYIEGLRDGRAVILDGERVEDVTTHPAFAAAVRSVAALYDFAADPANRARMTYPSPRDGRPVNLAWLTPRSREDLTARRLALKTWADATYGLMGRSPDHVASFFAGFAGAPDTFARGGPEFAANLHRYYEKARDEDLYLSYTIIHPTIDRAKPAHQQPEPHLYASVAGERDNGIVLRGAQMLGTGSVMSDYIFVSCILPLQPGDEDYAISVVVPNNAPGLKIYTRRPYALGAPSVFDYPLSARFDETDSLIVFDDVRVPWEHVFVYRNIEITTAQFRETPAHQLGNTQAQIRFVSKLQFLAGLAKRVCDASGTSKDAKTQERLGELAAQAAVPEAFVLAAEAACVTDANGVVRPNPEMLYAAMTLQPDLYNRMLYAVRDLCGGSLIQLPSSAASFGDAANAADLARYVRWPDAPAGERVKLLKLTWDMVGSEFAGRHLQYEMFYAGQPSVVKGRAYRAYPWEEALRLVDQCLAGYDLPVEAAPAPAGVGEGRGDG
jgi:4-hydroxyphenylacetate 3-monooxygenase